MMIRAQIKEIIAITTPIYVQILIGKELKLVIPSTAKFHNLVIDLHRKYDCINILLKRGETVHNDDERFQDYEKSLEIDKLCKKVLEENQVEYHTIEVNGKSVKKIMKLLDVK